MNDSLEMENEKRKYARYPYCYKIRKCNEDSNLIVEGFTNNISFGGLQFNSKHKYSKNDIIKVSIDDPRIGDLPFSFNVGVVWSMQVQSKDNIFITGVNFKEYSNKQHDFIFKVISEYIGIKHNENRKLLANEQHDKYEENPIERRKFVRFPYNCYVLKQKKGKKKWIDGFICEISLSGLQILTSQRYNNNECISIAFQDPIFEALTDKFQAEVIWCKESECLKETFIVGLKFKNCTNEQKRFLFSLISESIVRKTDKKINPEQSQKGETE